MHCIALCAVVCIQGKCVYESVFQSVLNKNDLVASACDLYKKEILKVFFSHLITSFKKTEMKFSFLTNTGLPLLYFVTQEKKTAEYEGVNLELFFRFVFIFFSCGMTQNHLYTHSWHKSLRCHSEIVFHALRVQVCFFQVTGHSTWAKSTLHPVFLQHQPLRPTYDRCWIKCRSH